MSELPPPTKQKQVDRLEGAPLRVRETEDISGQPPAAREHDRLAPGAFFAEHKALVDERRQHLARLGMDERHVAALRMPELRDAPMEPRGAPRSDSEGRAVRANEVSVHGTPAMQPVQAQVDESETLMPQATAEDADAAIRARLAPQPRRLNRDAPMRHDIEE